MLEAKQSSKNKIMAKNVLVGKLGIGDTKTILDYEELKNIPTLDGIELKGKLTKESLKIADAIELLNAQGDIANAEADILELQQAGYQTADDVSKSIKNAIKDITGIKYSVVEQLPNAGEAGTIYLVANEKTEEKNIYDEYIWIINKFEKIGTTAVDLSGYVKTSDLIEITNEEIDNLFA